MNPTILVPIRDPCNDGDLNDVKDEYCFDACVVLVAVDTLFTKLLAPLAPKEEINNSKSSRSLVDIIMSISHHNIMEFLGLGDWSNDVFLSILTHSGFPWSESSILVAN